MPKFLAFVKRNRVVFFAFAVLVSGAAFTITHYLFQTITSQCWSSEQVFLEAGANLEIKCEITNQIWQPINFRASFWGATGGASGVTLDVPAKVQIKDPSGLLIYESEFVNGKSSTTFRPELIGTYTAVITSLDELNQRMPAKTAQLTYYFGYIDFNETIGTLSATGNLLLLFGIVFTIISVAKTAAGWRNSLIHG
jgi:hypothetical protein